MAIGRSGKILPQASFAESAAATPPATTIAPKETMHRLNLPQDLQWRHARDQRNKCRSLGRLTIQWILDNIPRGSNIVELGSGLGTCILSHGYQMYSIENNKDWLGHCPKSHYIYAEIQPNWWYDEAPIRAGLPTEYRLLIIDAPQRRRKLVRHLKLFRNDIPWLFDDAGYPDVLNMATALSVKWNRKLTVFGDDGAQRKIVAIVEAGQ